MPESTDIVIERDVRIAMRDGTQLVADLYYPKGDGKFPVLLERTPYNRKESVLLKTGTPQYLAGRGYMVVLQDVRGRFDSEGQWFPFIDDGWGARQDGYDTVEWLAQHPKCNGKVGTTGGSYAGQTQLLLAVTQPKHLSCCFIREAPSDLANQWLYRGGAFELGFNIEWNLRHSLHGVYRQFNLVKTALNRKPELFAEHPWLDHDDLADPFRWMRATMAHPDKDEFYDLLDVEPHYASMNAPMLHLAGWFDIFLQGTLHNFEGIRTKAKAQRIRQAQRLIIGPWPHGPMMNDPDFARTVGDLDFGPDAVFDVNREMVDWFDYWMTGRGALADAPVKYFLMGANQWCTADVWPPPGISTKLMYFRKGSKSERYSLNSGVLSSEKPPRQESADGYRYDPSSPVPSIGGATLFSVGTRKAPNGAQVPDLEAVAGPRDQNPIAAQCLSYRSEPLTESLKVVGPVVVQLYASSSACDTDFVAKLCDVFPDGRAILVADGILRARYRQGADKPKLLKSGVVYRFDVDLWSTAWQFEVGHSLQVMVTSSCHPRYDCNPNTGKTVAESADFKVANNRIYHDPKHPSCIALSVLP